ncbi:leucyl aminopeptidase [Ammoniphilus oxalaticus]|uniref:Probable cytosol aminopeptidase n=1 Tax=Ammoniphilus oxalaticus TaxID=66863 RepID=A0A419SFR5_9BACL|nr:leucyl aminopeptidase [Ammoniphilus oxalaticus]RKD22619.1 leucyl aminopeptidase [Ammoniphilus oxalaticus]
MEVKTTTETISELAADCLVLTMYEGQQSAKGSLKEVDEALQNRLSELIASGEVKGKFGEMTLLYNWGQIPAKRTLVVGVGNEQKFTLDKLRDALGIAARFVRDKGISRFTFSVSEQLGEPTKVVRAAIEGVELGAYRFAGYKQATQSKDTFEEMTLVIDAALDQESIQKAIKRAKAAAEATKLARDLVNEPSNLLTPAALARRAEEVALRRNLEVNVLHKQEIEQMGMGALLAVGKAGANEPKMIVMKYHGNPASKEVIGLVGKGITFDTGGIQVKPDEGMEEMKTDMGGAAAVIAAMDGIGALQPQTNVIAVVPACENMVAGNNVKPSDVIPSFSGKTIEVIHTDAEGRLILADGVAYAKHLGATKLVDVATLTGSVISALGYAATGLITNQATWADQVKQAAQVTGEKVWELPNFEEYQEYLESEIADLKNDAGRPAGCIQGGIFIGAFAEDTPWVHLDIAGTVTTKKDQGHHPAGATGVMTRALLELIAPSDSI